jgi:hypothetical protein
MRSAQKGEAALSSLQKKKAPDSSGAFLLLCFRHRPLHAGDPCGDRVMDGPDEPGHDDW